MVTVSVLTSTANRACFMPRLIEMYKAQLYPHEDMEWIILDDGEESVEDFFTDISLPNIRYIRSSARQTMGTKLNRLVYEARGDILLVMDDDDYYPPERVPAVVTGFRQNPKYELAGSSEIYLYYSDIETIYKLGPYHNKHATNGTMAWKRSYADTHTYDETVTHAEERSFLDDYVNPMLQLDPKKVMLVMSHSENTFDKKKLRDAVDSPFIKKTPLKMRDFVKEPQLREFFKKA